MIVSYCGLLGHGKTHSLTEAALQLCEETNKDLVTNVKLDMAELEKWCYSKRLFRVARKVARDRVFHDTDLNRMFSFERCVVMVDELGIFANSRKLLNSWEDFERFMFDLVLSRKAGIDFLWTAQDHEMVDKNIRRLTNFYWHTFRWFGKDLMLGKNRDIKFLTRFDAGGYAKWSQDMCRQLWWKHKLEYRFRFFDASLFKVYNTLERLDKSQSYSLDDVAADLGVVDPLAPRTERRMIELPPGYRPRANRDCPLVRPATVRAAWLREHQPKAGPAAPQLALTQDEEQQLDDRSDDLLARLVMGIERGIQDYETFRGLSAAPALPPKAGPVIGSWPPPPPPAPAAPVKRKRPQISADTLPGEFRP